MTDPLLKGPVCLLTVPFNQLANMKIFAKAFGIQSHFFGAFPGGLQWLVCSERNGWPREFPDYFQHTGIKLRDIENMGISYPEDKSTWTNELS